MTPRRGRCVHCGQPLEQPRGPGRPRTYCSDRCRRAYRRQRVQLVVLAALLDRSDPAVAEWLKDCGL